jgi:hypothetical protein
MDLINWKTTAMGATIVLVWLIKIIWGIECPSGVVEGITAILTFLGFYFAKDKNVTGGTTANK